MRWLLPYPLATAGLFVLWLLLSQSLAPGQILIGAAAALAGGLALTALELPKVRARRLGTMIRLVALVLADIIRSNIAVARLILGRTNPNRRPGFVHIPLELRDPYGLAALACIITSTPGTLWVSHDAASGVLVIHVLDLIDESEWVRTIKGRYERRLMEIFE
jgi:multicomponent K+:H+ antiporter subunit E